MKAQRIAVRASQALNWDGNEAGLPQHSSTDRNNAAEDALFDGASWPEGWTTAFKRQGIQRHANHPLATSDEYNNAIAACEAERRARQKQQSDYALSSPAIEWNWRMVALVIWLVLIAIVCTGLVGCG